MRRGVLAASAVVWLWTVTAAGNAVSCGRAPRPPRVWVVRSAYPFQAGAEKAYADLPHGPWRTERPVTLYARPRSRQVVGELAAGVAVQAGVGRTFVVEPIRLVAERDFKVERAGRRMGLVRRGEAFWVLDSGNEGMYAVWWRCGVAGWDSTDPGVATDAATAGLGRNQERWVRVRGRGVVGWMLLDAGGGGLVPVRHGAGG